MDQALAYIAVQRRHREVLSDRLALEHRLGAPLPRDVADATRGSGFRRGDLCRFTIEITDNLPGNRAEAPQRLDERILPVTLKAGDTDEFARTNFNVYRSAPWAQHKVLGGQRHTAGLGAGRGLADLRRRQVLGPGHQAHEFPWCRLIHAERRDGVT